MRLLYGRCAIYNVLPSTPFHLLLDDVLSFFQWLNKELLVFCPDHSRLEKISDDILDKNLIHYLHKTPLNISSISLFEMSEPIVTNSAICTKHTDLDQYLDDCTVTLFCP